VAACIGRVLVGVCMSHCSGVVIVVTGYIYKKENKFGAAQRMTGCVCVRFVLGDFESYACSTAFTFVILTFRPPNVRGTQI
jgi:hypothetical protein